MIDIAVARTVAELNAYFNLRASWGASVVAAASLFDREGKPTEAARNKLVTLLVNVERDPVYRPTQTLYQRDDGTAAVSRPELKLNLYLLFVANHELYDQALKMLSLATTFFQARNVFDLTANGERSRLVFELVSMTFEQQNHLWGAIGGKYMPSLLFKAGLLNVRDAVIEAEVPPVEEILINE
jgi:hypothetical protein